MGGRGTAADSPVPRFGRKQVRAALLAVVAFATAGALWLGSATVSCAQSPLPVMSFDAFGPSDAEVEGQAVEFALSLSQASTTDIGVTYSTILGLLKELTIEQMDSNWDSK